MSKHIINDLIWQFQHALATFYEEVDRFTAAQWVTGYAFFQVPAKQAIHLLECLDYYFAEDLAASYPWGERFGGGWWELKDDELPDKAAILAFAREIEAKVLAVLSELEDKDLFNPLTGEKDWADTLLGHYTYALRHTAHHQGQLGSLASYFGHAGGSWDW